MYILFVAVALSIDAFGVGMALGMKKISLPLSAVLTLSLTGIIILFTATMGGNLIFKAIPSEYTHIVSSLIFVVMGVWIIKQGLSDIKKEKNTKEYSFLIKYLGITVNIVRTPEYGDLNNSRSIEIYEAVFIGVALSLDSVVVCLSSNSTFLLPMFILMFQLAFILWGNILGKKLKLPCNTKACTLLSGTLIIIIGFLQLLA